MGYILSPKVAYNFTGDIILSFEELETIETKGMIEIDTHSKGLSSFVFLIVGLMILLIIFFITLIRMKRNSFKYKLLVRTTKRRKEEYQLIKRKTTYGTYEVSS